MLLTKDIIGNYEVTIASSEKPRKKLVISSIVRDDEVISFFTVYLDSKKVEASVYLQVVLTKYNNL